MDTSRDQNNMQPNWSPIIQADIVDGKLPSIASIDLLQGACLGQRRDGRVVLPKDFDAISNSSSSMFSPPSIGNH